MINLVFSKDLKVQEAVLSSYKHLYLEDKYSNTKKA